MFEGLSVFFTDSPVLKEGHLIVFVSCLQIFLCALWIYCTPALLQSPCGCLLHWLTHWLFCHFDDHMNYSLIHTTNSVYKVQAKMIQDYVSTLQSCRTYPELYCGGPPGEIEWQGNTRPLTGSLISGSDWHSSVRLTYSLGLLEEWGREARKGDPPRGASSSVSSTVSKLYEAD